MNLQDSHHVRISTHVKPSFVREESHTTQTSSVGEGPCISNVLQILSGGGGCSDEGLGLSCAPVGGPEHLLLPGTLFLSAQGELDSSNGFSNFLTCFDTQCDEVQIFSLSFHLNYLQSFIFPPSFLPSCVLNQLSNLSSLLLVAFLISLYI